MSKDMKILVTGVNGQLGYDCVRELNERGYTNVKGIDIDDLDITNEEDALKVLMVVLAIEIISLNGRRYNAIYNSNS